MRRESDDLFRLVSDGVYMFQGLADATMSHEEGWHYIQLGRFIERAQATALVLDIHSSAFPEATAGRDPAGRSRRLGHPAARLHGV